jgi:ATP-dependent RNA helicase DeaD
LKHIASKLGIEFAPAEIPALEAITKKRIARWSDNLKAQPINDKIGADLLTTVYGQFEDLSKEDLLAKLLTKEYNSIYKRNSITDLNDRSKPRDDDRGPRRERGPRNSNGGESGMKTFFVNLGRKDNMNKGSILGFVCDATGITGAEIGRIVLDGAHTFIDVNESVAAQMDKLNGTQRDGREIRANIHTGRVVESRDGGGRDGGGYKGRDGGGSRDGGSRDGGARKGGFKGRRSDESSAPRSASSGSGGGFRDRATKEKETGPRDGKSKTDKPVGDKGSRSKFFGSKWD